MENHTPRELTALKAKLVQRIDYHASRKTKVIHNTIARLEGKTTLTFQFLEDENLTLTACPTLNLFLFYFLYFSIVIFKK